MVSLVLPVYDERDNLAPIICEIEATLQGIEHEIIAVDDGSSDGSLDELVRLRKEFSSLRVVTLGKHVGQSAAFAAGFDAARGEIVATMDSDGQNDPADVPELVQLLQSNISYDAVAGYRANRADSGWKRLQSLIANRARNLITGDSIRDTGCSLKAVRKDALAGLPRFNGMHRFLATLIRLQGGTVIEVPVSHRPRLSGNSKYGMWNRAVRGLRDAMGVRWLGKRSLTYEARERR
jgi:dolichol-phosphate mannosyltransferase